ncbi:MAG: site-specific integrase [Actinomycetota bacterium]|nr:site-specific integrase [Actinomycetota bacterium]
MPVSIARYDDQLTWFDFACQYVDLKWKGAAATYRRGIAEAMVTVTMAMLTDGRGKPEDKAIRSVLFRWAFNTQRRKDENEKSEADSRVLMWVSANTRNVHTLGDKRILRPVMDAIASKLDGSPAAATVVNRKRAVLYNALDYAVELEQLEANPIPKLKWTAPKASRALDGRTVVNPIQARTMLNAIRETKRSGARLFACFACSYFAALRPEEAINVRISDFRLADPARPGDLGEFSLRRSAPHAGKAWTNSGKDRDDRGLKHRAHGEERPVPISPELNAILHAHLDEFGTDDDGRLFVGDRGGDVPVITYNRVWHKARASTFTEEVRKTPLAATPYTLRHAAVSTWLAGGVDPAQVAKWAGHSLEVLLQVYAKSLHGRETAARQLMGESYR